MTRTSLLSSRLNLVSFVADSNFQIIEDYLPYLLSVDHCLDHGIFVLDNEIGTLHVIVELIGVTSWRCTLTDSKLKNQPRIEQPTIYYEIAFVLLTYAYALVNWAGHGLAGNDPPDSKLNQVSSTLIIRD